MSILDFLHVHANEVLMRTAEHLGLAGISTIFACLIGIPTGVLLTRARRWSTLILGICGVLQTIPSLALLGVLVPLPGIGGIRARTAIVALILYALLPIIRNTFTGIQSVDPAICDAGRGMGMTESQLFWKVQLPLSARVILAGVRVAMVVSIGVATIAAYIGAGGLGMFIFRGISTLDNTLILAGAVPAALLAIFVDLILEWCERRFTFSETTA